MKCCPVCGRRYEKADIRFCLDDGTALVAVEAQRRAVANHGGRDTDVQFDRTIAPSSTLQDHQTQAQVQGGGLLPPGTRVGEYLIERKIGEGGMGMIFAAAHPIIAKQVAIKVLNPALAESADVVARFVQEAKSVNQIRHRNIVDIFSFGSLPDGRSYFVMELLEGESLAQRLGSPPVPWAEAAQIWIQVASAIEAAHKHGIVHRDLKPDNVFLSPSAEGPFVKVLDFGIAKLLGDAPMGMTKTSTGMPIGTPTYMAPEQAAGATVDHRTDLYSFGVMLFEIIAGRPPFVGQTVIQLLHDHMNALPPDLSTLVRSVHPELRTLVDRLLEKEPSRRPSNMAAVRAELLRLRDLALADRRPLYGDAMPDAPAAPRRTRRPLGPLAGGLAAAVIASGLLVARFRPHKAPPPPLPLPLPAVDPAGAPPAKPVHTGRLMISTNTATTRVFLDKSEQDRSPQPAAAGGNNLRLPVPPDVDWVLRVESPGYKTVQMPLRIADGEETALPVVLIADAPATVAKKPHEPPPVAAERPALTKPATPKTDNEKFLDPFEAR